MPKFLICLLALPLCCSAADADDWISPDRPDFVDSPNVVGKGRLQLEAGWQRARNRDSGATELAGSTPLLARIGLSDDLELRLETDGRVSYRNGPVQQHGWGDVGVAVKWHLRDGGEGTPAVGLIAQADFASGSADFKGQGTRPSLRMPVELDLDPQWTVGVMPGIYLDRDDSGRRGTTAMFGVTLARSLSERAFVFAELAAPRIARSRMGGSTASLDVGGGYALSRDVQLDVALSRGLNRRTPDLSLNIGVSVRL